jgi:hypothetical protein
VSASVTVTADAVQVGWPSGAGDSLPLGTTTAAEPVGVGDGPLVGVTSDVGVGDAELVGVCTAAGVELEQATASRRVARLTALLVLLLVFCTTGTLRRAPRGSGDPGR